MVFALIALGYTCYGILELIFRARRSVHAGVVLALTLIGAFNLETAAGGLVVGLLHRGSVALFAPG